MLVRLETQKPNVPVDAIVIGSAKARTPEDIPGLARELEFAPLFAVVADLYNGFIARLADAAKSAVRIDKSKGMKACVHDLSLAVASLEQVVNDGA